MKDDSYKGELHAWIEPEIEARVVALILGEASEFEADELERMMEERPEIRIFQRRLQSLHGLLGETLLPGDDEAWSLAPERKESLFQAMDLAPRVEEVEVIAPAVPSAARERQIRIAGRRVIWGAAACFVLTLVVAALLKRAEPKGAMELMARESKAEDFDQNGRQSNVYDNVLADPATFLPAEPAKQKSSSIAPMELSAPGSQQESSGLVAGGTLGSGPVEELSALGRALREEPAVGAGVAGKGLAPALDERGKAMPSSGTRSKLADLRRNLTLEQGVSGGTEEDLPAIDSLSAERLDVEDEGLGEPAENQPQAAAPADIVTGTARGGGLGGGGAPAKPEETVAETAPPPVPFGVTHLVPGDVSTPTPAPPSAPPVVAALAAKPAGPVTGPELAQPAPAEGEEMSLFGRRSRFAAPSERPAAPEQSLAENGRHWLDSEQGRGADPNGETGESGNGVMTRSKSLAFELEDKSPGPDAISEGRLKSAAFGDLLRDDSDNPVNGRGEDPGQGQGPGAAKAIDAKRMAKLDGAVDEFDTKSESNRSTAWHGGKEDAAAVDDHVSLEAEVAREPAATAASGSAGKAEGAPAREAEATLKEVIDQEYARRGLSKDTVQGVADQRGLGLSEDGTETAQDFRRAHEAKDAGGEMDDPVRAATLTYRGPATDAAETAESDRLRSGRALDGAYRESGVEVANEERFKEPFLGGAFFEQSGPGEPAGSSKLLEKQVTQRDEALFDWQLDAVDKLTVPEDPNPAEGAPTVERFYKDQDLSLLGYTYNWSLPEVAKEGVDLPVQPEVREFDGFNHYGLPGGGPDDAKPDGLDRKAGALGGEQALNQRSTELLAQLRSTLEDSEEVAAAAASDRYFDSRNSGGKDGIDVIKLQTWDVPVEAWRKFQSGPATTPAALDAKELLAPGQDGEAAGDARQALRDYGISFPEGATLGYVVSSGKMVVKNTPENLTRIDELVAKTLKQLEREREVLDTLEQRAAAEPMSTFSLHVSDVSFKLVKAGLDRGEWPAPEQVRVEEFVNAFDYGDPAPTQEEKVACQLEQAAHPFLQQRNLLRISMRTAAFGRAAGTPLRLTVLLDKSGSMERFDRVESVRRAFDLLAAQLQPQDEISLVSFARTTRLIADRVTGDKAGQLADLVETTPSEGGTNLEEALRIGVEKAKSQFLEGGQNRIILLTDGAANLGNAKPEDLGRLVERMRQEGIAFDACGVGAKGLNDDILESLTRKGDGRYYFLDRPEDADAGFAKQIAGALRPAARNVKVQVNFNPERVGHYKLYGFEKHLLKKEDFHNDSVDAAEMAAEEAGNAIYQVETLPEGTGELGTVSVRFQDMASGRMVERMWTIPYDANAPRLDEAASSMRLASGAALLGEKLKGSVIGDAVEMDRLSQLINSLPSAYPADARVKELVEMAAKARGLSPE